jgi:hypothetical protein
MGLTSRVEGTDVVVTAYDVVAQLVTAFITSDPKAKARAAARMAHIIGRQPGCAPEETGCTTFGELSYGAFVSIVVLVFLRMQTHFLRKTTA